MRNVITAVPVAQELEKFFEATRAFEAAYQHDTFSFVAVIHMGAATLLQGRLVRNVNPINPNFAFKSDMLIAGRFRIAELNITTTEFLKKALIGKIPTPMGDVDFLPHEADGYRTNFTPFLEDFQAQYPSNFLLVEGAPVAGYIDAPTLGWHLRAQETPYDGLEDLLSSLELGQLSSNQNITAVAHPVMIIGNGSSIDGTKANIKVLLANGLPETSVRIGYRLISQGEIVRRSSLLGRDIKWEELSKFKEGRVEIDVPAASIMQCIASFNGVAQHRYWIMDPSTTRNPRLAAYKVADPDLSILREYLSRQGRVQGGQNARDIEFGVSWLLWLLGFSVAHLGLTGRTQDFVDVIATTPMGHLLVVECTTGLLKADNKMANLILRKGAVVRSLNDSNNRHLKVIPVMVTSMTSSDVQADLEQAERLGILVVTQEGINSLLERVIWMPDADKYFEEAERLIEEKLSGGMRLAT